MNNCGKILSELPYYNCIFATVKYSFTYLLLLGLGLYVPLKLVVSDLRNPIKNQRNQEVPHFCWKESVPMLGSGACSLFWSYMRPLIFLLFGIN